MSMLLLIVPPRKIMSITERIPVKIENKFYSNQQINFSICNNIDNYLG